jgi:predicted PurR-regulated permease PerM
MPPATPSSRPVRDLIDVILPLLLIALLVVLCVQLLLPFVGLLLWTFILAICFAPVQNWLLAKGWRPARAALLIGAFLVALIVIPTGLAAFHAASSIPPLVKSVLGGTVDIAPPPPRLQEIPLIGGKAHTAWTNAANDLPAFLKLHGDQFRDAGIWLLKHAAGMAMAVILFLFAAILAAVALAYASTLKSAFATMFARIAGDRGPHLIDLVGATVRSVGVGVIGIAFFQAIMCGIGYVAVGLPGAGLLFLVTLAFSIVHLPVILITVPAMAYVFATESTGVAIAFMAWSLFAGFSDAPLKPLLIGRGLDVPMPIILLGVIGGVIAYGLVGLFIGAVLLAVGYSLLMEWLDRPVGRITE